MWEKTQKSDLLAAEDKIAFGNLYVKEKCPVIWNSLTSM